MVSAKIMLYIIGNILLYVGIVATVIGIVRFIFAWIGDWDDDRYNSFPVYQFAMLLLYVGILVLGANIVYLHINGLL